MFVLQKTYDKLKIKYEILTLQYSSLLKEWNRLADLINSKGGYKFLNHGNLQSNTRQTSLSQEEICTLIKLCHPDKHGNSKKATEITQRLLSMRK